MFRAGFPDLRFATEEVLTAGDKVVVRACVTGTHQGEFMGIPPTGKSIDMPVIDIIRFGDDGFAHEHWGIFDQMRLMQQLGVAPGPGGPPRSSDRSAFLGARWPRRRFFHENVSKRT